MKTRYSIFAIIVLGCICYDCHKQDTSMIIDVSYQNWTIECITSPSWEEVINGEHPEFLVKAIISDKNIYDSIINQIKLLSPMKRGAIPEDCRTEMQCIIHYPRTKKTDTLLIGDWCISLNRVVMKDNDVLVQLIKKHSGYYHPPNRNL